MPDLLIVGPPDESTRIEAIAAELGIRSKSTIHPEAAAQWLKLRPFSLAAVHTAVPVVEQERLATMLWTARPVAPFIVFDLGSESYAAEQESRLFGAELALGAMALPFLSDRISSLVPLGAEFTGEFGVLVVEDLDSPRDIICAYIERLGFPRVTGMGSARAAMAELEQNPGRFQCIVTDIRMPELNGQQFIELVRGNPKLQHLPIIALTAWGTVDTLVECLRAGASGFLVKPPRKPDLSRELGRAFRIAQRRGSPRLASHDEAETIRRILLDRGLG